MRLVILAFFCALAPAAEALNLSGSDQQSWAVIIKKAAGDTHPTKVINISGGSLLTAQLSVLSPLSPVELRISKCTDVDLVRSGISDLRSLRTLVVDAVDLRGTSLIHESLFAIHLSGELAVPSSIRLPSIKAASFSGMSLIPQLFNGYGEGFEALAISNCIVPRAAMDSLPQGITRIQISGSEVLAEHLAAFATLPRLLYLDLSSSSVQALPAKAMPALSALNLSHAKVGPPLIDFLAATLGEAKTCNMIFLSGLGIGDGMVEVMCKFLEARPSIKSVSLGANQISPAGAAAIINASSLEVIGLEKMGWGRKQIEDFVQKVVRFPSRIGLASNAINDDCAAALAAFSGCSSLNLIGNPISPDAIRKLRKDMPGVVVHY